MASLIFKDESSVPLNQELDPDLNYINRTKVFDTIVEFFPEEMTQPKGNLVDLVLVWGPALQLLPLIMFSVFNSTLKLFYFEYFNNVLNNEK